MADQYKCKKCSKTSPKPGSCCGQAMEKVSYGGQRVLRSISDLRRVTIAATDGEVGSVRDLYFDDLRWTVRYLVIDAGSWLPDRWVLVSPTSLRRWDPDPNTLQVAQTKTQVKASVDMHTLPGVVRSQARACRESHLQAATTVMGYAVETEDGEIGHVEDLLVDDTAWVIRYLRVDTKNRWADKRVLVAPEWLTRVTWDDSKRFFSIVTAVDERDRWDASLRQRHALASEPRTGQSARCL